MINNINDNDIYLSRHIAAKYIIQMCQFGPLTSITMLCFNIMLIYGLFQMNFDFNNNIMVMMSGYMIIIENIIWFIYTIMTVYTIYSNIDHIVNKNKITNKNFISNLLFIINIPVNLFLFYYLFFEQSNYQNKNFYVFLGLIIFQNLLIYFLIILNLIAYHFRNTSNCMNNWNYLFEDLHKSLIIIRDLNFIQSEKENYISIN